MALDFYEWEIGDVVVLHLTGRITLGEGTSKLRKIVRDTLERGRVKIVLNLAEIVFIDSSGLGELVSSYTAVKRAAGQIKLSNLTQRAQDLLQLTKVYTIFDVYSDEDSAVRSFPADAAPSEKPSPENQPL